MLRLNDWQAAGAVSTPEAAARGAWAASPATSPAAAACGCSCAALGLRAVGLLAC